MASRCSSVGPLRIAYAKSLLSPRRRGGAPTRAGYGLYAGPLGHIVSLAARVGSVLAAIEYANLRWMALTRWPTIATTRGSCR